MRFVALDQIRGVAISAMILAHLGPGFYDRIGLEGALLDTLLLIGRFATPTFIAIFGFTLAFAYLPKAITDPAAVRVKLIGRSRLVLLSAIAVSVPSMITTLQSDSYWGNALSLNIFLNLYGVLLFYALAIFSTGLLIGPISRAPYTFPAVVGSGLIFTGTWLGYDAWGPEPGTATELFRLFFVSGKYAYFVSFGFCLMLVSLGWHMRGLRKNGVRLAPVLLAIGVMMLFCGLSMGRIVGWRTLSDLHTGYAAPPQFWYLCTVCGVMFSALALFDSIKIPVVSFIMEHTGRNPLSIYIAHAFVLDSVSLLRALAPGLPDTIHVLLPFLIFLAYWASVVLHSNRARSGRSQRPCLDARDSPTLTGA